MGHKGGRYFDLLLTSVVNGRVKTLFCLYFLVVPAGFEPATASSTRYSFGPSLADLACAGLAVGKSCVSLSNLLR